MKWPTWLPWWVWPFPISGFMIWRRTRIHWFVEKAKDKPGEWWTFTIRINHWGKPS